MQLVKRIVGWIILVAIMISGMVLPLLPYFSFFIAFLIALGVLIGVVLFIFTLSWLLFS